MWTKTSSQRFLFLTQVSHVCVFVCGQVVSELKGKDVNEVIAEGKTKLACMPSGQTRMRDALQLTVGVLLGGGAVAASTAAGGAAGGDAAEEKKEEKKKEESEEESDDDMGFGLFDQPL